MQGTCPVPDPPGSTVGKMVFAGGALGWRGRGGRVASPGCSPAVSPRESVRPVELRVPGGRTDCRLPTTADHEAPGAGSGRDGEGGGGQPQLTPCGVGSKSLCPDSGHTARRLGHAEDATLSRRAGWGPAPAAAAGVRGPRGQPLPH